ncbi:MAG: winged helix-turn-helix domain-containing protein [Xanthomonadales bacterium]|nr:winged helix-turn-helix domain-containing protein [Xanthomonadales bacterium]
MDAAGYPDQPFRLDGWLVEPTRLRITSPDASETRLSPKAMRVLVTLAGHQGVIGKAELMDLVWGRAEVTEGVLSQTVLEIRNGFGDDAKNPRFVETIRGVGFRLIPAVDRHAADPRTDSGPRRQKRSLRWGLPASILILGLVLAAAGIKWTTGSARLPPTPLVMIVPFSDQSPDGENGYFARGMADQIGLHIAGSDSLRLLSGRAVAELISGGSSVGEAARRLQADLLLTGTLNRRENQLDLMARLTNARTSEELWVIRLNRPAAEVFAMQEEVATALASIIERGEALPQRGAPTQDLAAYDLYLRGRERQRQFTDPELATAADYFEQALALDPNFALARAALAEVFAVRGFIFRSNDSYLQRALREAELALLAEHWIPEGLYARALALMGTGRLARARERAAEAVEIAPGNAEIRFLAASLADARGQVAAAVENYRIAFQLDPLLPRTVALGRWYYLLGRPAAQALQVAERGHDLNPGYPTLYLAHLLTLMGELDRAQSLCHAVLGLNLPRSRNLCGFTALLSGKDEEARLLLGKSWQSAPRAQWGPFSFAASATHLALLAEPEEKNKLLEESEAVTREAIADGNDHWALRYNMAAVASQQGDSISAAQWMELAYQEGFRDWRLLEIDPALQTYRDNPEYPAIARQIREDLQRQASELPDTPGR